MPKLDLKSSHEYWKNFEDDMIYRVVTFMESVEKWTVDGQAEIEQIMTELGDALEELNNFELKQEEDFVHIACHLKMSRVLRLLQAIDTIEPGSASKVLMFAEENSIGGDETINLFLRRNIVFERLRLLARVFSPSRLSIALNALENEDNA